MAKNNIKKTGGLSGETQPPLTDGNNIRPFKKAKKKTNRQKLAAANNIRSLTESGFGLNIPLSDWKDIPSGIKNDPDFIKLRLKRLKAQNGKSKRRKV